MNRNLVVHPFDRVEFKKKQTLIDFYDIFGKICSEKQKKKYFLKNKSDFLTDVARSHDSKVRGKGQFSHISRGILPPGTEDTWVKNLMNVRLDF